MEASSWNLDPLGAHSHPVLPLTSGRKVGGHPNHPTPRLQYPAVVIPSNSYSSGAVSVVNQTRSPDKMEPYRQENDHEARTSMTDHAQRSRWLSGAFGHSASLLDMNPFSCYLVDPQIQADHSQAREDNDDAQQPQPPDSEHVRYPSYPADGQPYPSQCPVPPSPVSMSVPADGQTPNHLQPPRRGPAIHHRLYAGHGGVQFAGGALGQMMPSPTFTAPGWPPTPSPISVPGEGFRGVEAGYPGYPDAWSPWPGAEDDPAWPPGRRESPG